MTTIPEESHNETTPFTEEQCHFLERAIATVVANTTVHPQTPVPPPILSNANLPKPTKPDNFTPGRNADVKLWLFQLEQYLRFTNLPRERYVEYAAALFRGSAISWWRTQLHGNQSLPANWEEFKDTMQRTFSPINHVKLARDRLSKLRQTYSVQDYVWRFQSLCLEIPDISEGEILDRFVRGLKGQIRKEVELRGLTNFQEIVQTAQRVDAIHYQNRGSFSTPSFSYSNGPAPMELGALQDVNLQDKTHPGINKDVNHDRIPINSTKLNEPIFSLADLANLFQTHREHISAGMADVFTAAASAISPLTVPYDPDNPIISNRNRRETMGGGLRPAQDKTFTRLDSHPFPIYME